MTREEALKVASEMHGWLKTDREKEALETLIPELKESEDERIIKTLQEYVKTRNWNLGGPTQDEVLAWLERQKECLADNSRIMKELISFLKEEIPQCSIKEHAEKLKEFVSYLEKQKYDRMKPIYDARESFESALEKAWNDYHNGYENVDKLEDDYVECAHAKGFREGYLFGIEKRKPIISIDQLKSMMLQYLQEAANEKDDSDIEADTDKWARKILGYAFDRKPAWSEEDESHREFILESLEDQIRFCKKDAEGAYYAKQIRTAQNWLKALHERFNIQPKPDVECDNETEVQKAYREGKNAGRKEVFDHPEYYGLQPRRTYDYETGERNPEWGEEDEKTINELCDIIASNAKNGYLGGYYAPDLVKKLKSLHHQPKQEWSKEDENKVERLAFLVSIAAEKEMISEEECIDLRRFVKSYHPQPKKEWSEEDEKMLYQVLCYLDPTITRAKREEIELWLKSLLERFNLQPKQERNEEDEKVRKWLLEYFYLHRDDLRGASVTSTEVLSFLDKHPGKENACDAHEFDPKPGEKFWVRCKTNKTVNLWFDKDDERPAYAVDADGIITYIVHIKKDGTGNCVSYQNKEKFLETFDILESK